MDTKVNKRTIIKHLRPSNMFSNSFVGPPALPLVGLHQNEDIVDSHRQYQERNDFDDDQRRRYSGETEHTHWAYYWR